MTIAEEKSADRRYSELLQQFDMLGETTIKDLLMEFDAVVGERLAEVREKAIAEAAGGFVVEGQIRLGGASIDSWDVSVKVPASPLSPSFDDCKCGWGRATFEERLAQETDHSLAWSYVSIENGQFLHGWLLELEGSDPLQAVSELLVHLRDSCTPRDRTFDEIVAQHNWRDPVTMQDFSRTIETVWGDFGPAHG